MSYRCTEGDCMASTNPRNTDTCVKCGYPLPEPSPTPDETATFFRRLHEYATAAAGLGAPGDLDFEAFQREATDRLRRGAAEHGERNFLADGVDPIVEAREEAADGPNWILGEMVRHPERWDSPALWGAAYDFLRAHHKLRQALQEE